VPTLPIRRLVFKPQEDNFVKRIGGCGRTSKSGHDSAFLFPDSVGYDLFGHGQEFLRDRTIHY
jgi:hypothetical protein